MTETLEELEPETNEVLRNLFEVSVFAPDEPVIREGEYHRNLFFLKKGLLRVEQATLGVSHYIAHIHEEEWFGEISFFTGMPATAAVIVEQEATVLSAEQASLEKNLAEHPAFAARFYRALSITLAKRLKESTHPVIQPGAWG